MSANAIACNQPASPGDSRRLELVNLVARFAPSEGMQETAIEPLQLIRASEPRPGLWTIYEPGLCVVVQGRKQVTLAGEAFRYDPLNYLLVSVTLPVIGQVIEASPQQPYLCVYLALDPREIGELMLEAGVPVRAAAPTERGLYVSRVSDELLDAVLRLLKLLLAPRDAVVLSPLFLREIYYRVLVGELGPRLRDLAVADSHAQRIARVIDLLKRRYTEPLRIEDLAATAHLSPSSLHQHFKAVTAVSPLQFQKQLRLHEARRLMLAEGLDAVVACHRVGYESASQFSREYKRLFGAPPRREIAQLRNHAPSNTMAGRAGAT